jgi:REP element-mobilizing transposase RayT
MNSAQWDDNTFPLAFFITFRTYGTWLHGDERKSVDRHGYNVYGRDRRPADAKLQQVMRQNQSSDDVLLNGKQRAIVERAVRDVCKRRGYRLIAINVRTNHVHCVIAAEARPEMIISALKANCTRCLREAELVSETGRVWSRGGSRRYLWKPQSLERAVDYVLNGQGDDLPNF